MDFKINEEENSRSIRDKILKLIRNENQMESNYGTSLSDIFTKEAKQARQKFWDKLLTKN